MVRSNVWIKPNLGSIDMKDGGNTLSQFFLSYGVDG